MNKSFFTSKRDSVLAAGSDNFSTRISAQPDSYGLSVPEAAAYASLNAVFQQAYLAAITPSTRTKSTVAAKNGARTLLRVMASDLSRIINGNPVSDAQKIDLGIAVKAARSPRPAPGMPYQFKATLAADGSLTLAWKCANPRGSAGTIYQVWRRDGAGGEAGGVTYLGAAGKRQFVDGTLPAGTARVTYQVQAVRTTAVGPVGRHDVNFGVSGGTPTAQAIPAETVAARLAA